MVTEKEAIHPIDNEQLNGEKKIETGKYHKTFCMFCEKDLIKTVDTDQIIVKYDFYHGINTKH